MDINATLLGQAITFAILVWFTMKFVWPPLTNLMDERAKRIADGLAAAERGKQDLEQASKRVDEQIRLAKQQASELVLMAEKRAAQIVDEAKQAAKTESEKILVDARAQIGQEVLRAKEDLRGQVADLAVVGAEKILKREIDANAQKSLIDQLVTEI